MSYPKSLNHFIQVNPNDHAAIVDALYRFGAGQDLHDRSLFESAFSQDAAVDFVTRSNSLPPRP